MTKRILHIIPTLERGGAEKQLTLLAAGLPRDEFDVQVCALTRGGPYAADLKAAGVPVTIIDKRFKTDPWAYWRLLRFIKHFKPDLVQTWLFAANAYGRVAARQAGVPVIVASERCVDAWKGYWHGVIDRRLAKHTQRIVCNSAAIRDFYVERGIAAEKFVVIANGVPPLPASRYARTALLTELGVSPTARLLVTVGRLWPQKRMKDLIWACELLKNLYHDLHLLIVGDGPQRARLESYAARVHIADRVHFLGARTDVADILPHCECLWLASEYEGQPNAILEAMMAGLPVVATEIPGIRDIVLENQTGYLVPVGDRGLIAARTKRILDSPALGQQLGAAGKQRADRDFNVAQMIRRHAELYRQLLHIS